MCQSFSFPCPLYVSTSGDTLAMHCSVTNIQAKGCLDPTCKGEQATDTAGGHVREAASGIELCVLGPPECTAPLGQSLMGKAPRASATECLLLLFCLYVLATVIFFSVIWHGMNGCEGFPAASNIVSLL